jgi:hypothetical protein
MVNVLKRSARRLAVGLTMSQARLTAVLLQRFVRDNAAHGLFARHGFQLLRDHYYNPIPDREDLPESYWTTRSELPGVDLNLPHALTVLREEIVPHLDEFRRTFPMEKPEGGEGFYLMNYAFMAVDAHVYYALIRARRPRRIVEIGSGFSTLVGVEAARRNRADGSPCAVTAVEPYPAGRLRRAVGEELALIEEKVQAVPMELFTSLEAGDILFIDSTHVLREGGDVWWEYCEILPRLQRGVLVHIHDVSLPRPYPRQYFEKDLYFWNEQYLLQAFLAFNNRFRVIFPGNALMLDHPDEMHRAFPEIAAMRERFPSSEPASFWMEAA